jgi:hypothetical protein
MRDLQQVVEEVDPAATLAAFPDAITGHRLAGSAPDRARVQRALAESGTSPIVINAFRERQSTGRVVDCS